MIKSYNYLNTRGEDQYNNITTPEPQPPNNLTSLPARKSRKIERMCGKYDIIILINNKY